VGIPTEDPGPNLNTGTPLTRATTCPHRRRVTPRVGLAAGRVTGVRSPSKILSGEPTIIVQCGPTQCTYQATCVCVCVCTLSDTKAHEAPPPDAEPKVAILELTAGKILGDVHRDSDSPHSVGG
jgi:hypothetical protein